MIDIDVRDPDVPLSEVGRRQAAAVDRRRKDAPLELRPTLLAPHFDVTLSDLRHSQGSPLVQCAVAVHFRPGEATPTAHSASQERASRPLPRHLGRLCPRLDDSDVKHLAWLRERIGDQLLDAAVLTTGERAYRRADGIAVIPLALLGP